MLNFNVTVLVSKLKMPITVSAAGACRSLVKQAIVTKAAKSNGKINLIFFTFSS